MPYHYEQLNEYEQYLNRNFSIFMANKRWRVIKTGQALCLTSITEKTAASVINLRRTTEIENALSVLELNKHTCL